MMRQFLKKMLHKIMNLIEHRRINNNINRLQSLEIKPARGNADWLALCEIKMGGIQQNVTRLKVSDLDPRSKIHIQTGGMTGGDRMIHHNYAKLYERYLSRFIGTSENLNILECGILKGTGLAVWSELFPKATLIGLDIDLDHINSNFEFLKSRGAFQNNDPLLLNFDQFSPDVSELSEAIGSEKLNIIIWRDAAHDGAENLAAFVNQCPHLGLPLETFPDRFLAANGESLICSAHGAQFDKKGTCFAGPCEGRALVALALQLAGDDILIA